MKEAFQVTLYAEAIVIAAIIAIICSIAGLPQQ